MLPYFEAPEPWELDAKCATKINGVPKYDPDMWFPPRDKNLYKPIADKAKSICFGRDGQPPCPVREECLLTAERRNQMHGIWGGLSHRERNAMKRKAEKLGMTFEEYVKKQKTK